MDALRAPVLVLAAIGLAVYWIGLVITISAAWSALRREHPPVDRSALMNPASGPLRLEAPFISDWERIAGRIGFRAFVPAMILALLAGYFAPFLSVLAVVVMFPINTAYVWAIESLGRPLVLTADGFTLGDGRSQVSVRWVHVTDMVMGRGQTFIRPPRSIEASGLSPEQATAVLFRVNRALVHMKRTRAYWDGSVTNSFGIDTRDLLDGMRLRQSKAAASAAAPIGRKPPEKEA